MVVSYLLAKFDQIKEKHLKNEKEKKNLLLQQHHSMRLFNKRFCHNFTNIFLGLNLNFEQLETAPQEDLQGLKEKIVF